MRVRAEALMRAAADGEDASVKSVQMENRLYPMRELYADLLLQNGKAAEASRKFEASLSEKPNRYRGLYRAAMPTHAVGPKRAPARHLQADVAPSKHPDNPQPQILPRQE